MLTYCFAPVSIMLEIARNQSNGPVRISCFKSFPTEKTPAEEGQAGKREQVQTGNSTTKHEVVNLHLKLPSSLSPVASPSPYYYLAWRLIH